MDISTIAANRPDTAGVPSYQTVRLPHRWWVTKGYAPDDIDKTRPIG
jgi:hypothetical protein